MKLTTITTTFLLSSAIFLGIGTHSITQNQIEMTTYTVSEGSHFSFPRVFKYRRNISTVKWDVVFNDDCNYIIRDGDKVSNDQKDWNKLCGVFYNIFNTRDETAMIGWRYNIELDEIELAPYYHINSGRDMFKPMMNVKRSEPFSLRLTIDRDNSNYIWNFQKEGFETSHEMAFQHTRSLCGFINFYFGGNRAAPQNISCDLEMFIK